CEYEFSLVLFGITPDSTGVEDALFEAGCDDATLAFRSGRPILTFSRSGNSIKDAIVSAINDVRKAGIGADVLRVDVCHLVTISEIARRIGRTRQVVHQYMRGQRGPGGFPGPVCEIGNGIMAWHWCEVAYWLWENDMIKEDLLRDAREVEAINSILEIECLKKRDSVLIESVRRSIGTFCESCS
ncbi:MAG: helix-turn-helix transcriptional regulator, partial [Planctomycetota bacterium]